MIKRNKGIALFKKKARIKTYTTITTTTTKTP